MVSNDGFATLEWQVKGSAQYRLFRITEEKAGQEFTSFADREQITVFRIDPGVYTFRVQACLKSEDAFPVCGKSSKALAVTVSDAIDQQDLARDGGAPSVYAEVDAAKRVVGGPDQLSPGLWYNPQRNGHGWSFYWANRLALPETHSLHGYEYDLEGIWFTYEAKSRFLDGPPPCGEGGYGDQCYWVYQNYRPLVARLKLVRTGSSSYSGGVYISRNGQEIHSGSATVVFGQNNTSATVNWSADFKRQNLADSDEVTLLVGSQAGEVNNMTHYAGMWADGGESSPIVIDNVGSNSEAVEVIFDDDAGDPTWIQAGNSWAPSNSSTSLCFYYVLEGYAPDSSGSINLVNSGCDAAQQASTGNRNGTRYFSGFEQGRFWISFELPAGSAGGGVSIGSSSSPGYLQKLSGFHRIFITQDQSTCEISDISGICPVRLTWFTDGDYPQATAYVVNQSSGQRQWVGSSNEPAMLDQVFNLDAPGSYRFELRMGASVGSSLLAESSLFTVTEAAMPVPRNLAAQWLEEANRSFRVQWSHDASQAVSFYELQEVTPGAGSATIHRVSPGTNMFIDLNRLSGPFGSYSYRVRACDQENGNTLCSAWSGQISWLVTDPGLSGSDAEHPWGDHAAGSGNLATNVNYRYAMGYHFRPETDGVVTELGGLFKGAKTVKLFERASGNLLAQAVVLANNSWSYSPIPPVVVNAGVEYTVAVYLDGTGGSYYPSPVLPVTNGAITVLGTTYVYTSSNPDAVPVNLVQSRMYGQADIGFVPGQAETNKPPQIESTFTDREDTVGDSITIRVQATDPDGDSLSYEATGLPNGLAMNVSSGIIGGVVADGADSDSPYTVTIKVSDPQGLTDQASFSWHILPPEPEGLPPANPDTPPDPAPRPDFSFDAGSATVGATSGEFSVDQRGAANYRIPIFTAPGSGGLAPGISLDYNSQSPNDIAGVGWTIGGLSSIGRCAATREQDGVAGNQGISLTRADRFCLDGQRLVVVSGEYGSDGAQYRTELDGFQKIVSYGAAGNGPRYFRVWHGDGSVSEYGNSEDSRLQTGSADEGGTVLSWARNRFSDGSSNYIRFIYHESNSGPIEHSLDKVLYTGNSRAGTSPYAEIRFTYSENRNDIPESYLQGNALSRKRLLTRIESAARARASDAAFTSLRSYFLSYGQDGYGRKTLESIQECSDNSRSYCFPETSFGWLKNEHTIPGGGLAVGSLFPGNFRGLDIADVNGDGRADLLLIKESKKRFSFNIAYAQRNGTFINDSRTYSIPNNGHKGTPVRLLVIDLNGDGFQDIIYPKAVSGGIAWVARISDSSGFGNETVVASDCCFVTAPRVARIMDFNGDGLADLLTNRVTSDSTGKGELVVLLNGYRPGGAARFEPFRTLTIDYADDLFPAGPTSGGWYVDDDAPRFADVVANSAVGAQPFDYNGDGRVDLLALVGRQYSRCDGNCPLNTVGTNRVAESSPLVSFQDPEDVDGVSRATASFYIVFESDGNDRFVQKFVAAAGAGLDCSVPDACEPWAHLPSAEHMRPVDINADGLADLVYRDGLDDWHYQLNTGVDFAASVLVARPPDDVRSHQAQFGDLNGDGFPEFLYPDLLHRDAANWVVHTNDLGSGFGAAESSGIRFGDISEGDGSILRDFNGDGMLDNLFVDFRRGVINSSTTRLYSGRNLITGSSYEAANVIDTITTATGATTALSYKPLTDSTVYTRMRDAANANWGQGSAVFDLVAPVFVVERVSVSAPTFENSAARSSVEYHYAGAKIQAGGRGFLGFGEVVSWNPQTGTRQNTLYRQDFPFIGLAGKSVSVLTDSSHKFRVLSDTSAASPADWQAVSKDMPVPAIVGGETLLSYSATQWEAAETVAGQSTWWPHARRVIARGQTLHGNLESLSLTSSQYQSFGRPVEVVVETWADASDAAFSTKTVRTQYIAPDLARWILSRVSKTSVTHQRHGLASQDRETAFSYDDVTGLLRSETIEPDSSIFRVKTTYGLDVFGNRVSTSISGAGMLARTSRSDYDPLGRFITNEVNHYGQAVSTVTRWNAFGVALEGSNIDGVATRSASDPMGHIHVNWTATGAWERSTSQWGAGSDCPSKTSYHLVSTGGGKPAQTTCYDLAGREIRVASGGFNGRAINVDSYYDQSGRKTRVSEPYYAGETRYWNLASFDELGRLAVADAASGDRVAHLYAGDVAGVCGVNDPRAEMTTNGLGQRQLEVRNVLGETVAVYDDHCGRLTFEYDAIGNLVKTVGADGEVVEMFYDQAGRKTAIDDPDKGYWRYAWNALGELVRQLDAQGQAIDYQYDAMGRMTDRWELRGVSSLNDSSFLVQQHENTVWQNSRFDGVRGKSQPLSVIYQRGEAGETIHRIDNSYDIFGRLERAVSTQSGMQFTEETSYDEFGRVFQKFDASGDYRGVKYEYETDGYLHKLIESRDGQDGVVYQEIHAMDARGNVTWMQLGNGVESFASYDNSSGILEKLEAYDRRGAELQDVDYIFDVLGNLRQRHDQSNGHDLAESFSYDSLNRLLTVELLAPAEGITTPLETLALSYGASGNITWKSDVGSYLYGAGNAGPHAVTSAGGEAYAYDANGNQLTGAGRNIEYSVFDKVVKIEKGGKQTGFAYGVGNRRIARTDLDAAGGSRTTHYIGNVEFIEEQETAFFKRHIAGLAVSDFYPASGASSTRYLVKDHLGSVHNVTDEDGAISTAVWLNHAAFGKRRAANWRDPLSQAVSASLNTLTTRGFTGHEHVDSLGVINMNGRIYDPKLGRFLQADPFIQAPKNTQNLNRYSYALNNPLSITDPSGYFFKRFLKRWGPLIAALALSVVLPGPGGLLATQFAVTNIYAQAAITGFIAGAITSGSLQGAVIGSLAAVAVAGIVQAFSTAKAGSALAKPDDLMPKLAKVEHLFGPNGPPAGLYRVEVNSNGIVSNFGAASINDIASGDVVFTNGVKNGFREAVRNGTSHLHQAGILKQSYILNFNPTRGMVPDLLEASRDIIGAHTGWTHSALARDLANTIHQLSANGISGIQLVGHSQGGAITASALRHAAKAGLNLSSLSGGGAALHGAPVNAWYARTKISGLTGVSIVSRAQFGDPVHVLGGLNMSNPLELPIALLRFPAVFSSDRGLSPHSLPCGGGKYAICGP